MTTFTRTEKSICIWKDELPAVHESKKGVPYVNIPDPQAPGETIRFRRVPGDNVDELYNLAAAYLALAQNMERSQS